jgi:hypothetical protein
MDLYEQIKAGEIKVHNYSPVMHRFWSFVNKDGPEHPTVGKCWEWLGHRQYKYGRFRIGRIRPRCGGYVRAHRFSYETFVGPVSEDMCVCHHCDNTICVNPSHLFLGDHVVNQADKMAKGRQAKGEGNGVAKLTEQQVETIRRRYRPRSKTDGGKALAKEFNVCGNTIDLIVNGYTWRHVGT